jgi:hypothetical protein
MPMRFLFIMTTIALVTLVGCATPPAERLRAPAQEARPCCRSVEPASNESAIVRTAAKLVGAKTITVNGRRIAYDCAGVIRAVYLKHGIDLYDGEPSDPDANGVRIIHEHIRQQGTFHQGPVVHPGDLVFFDNTWDYNGDGKVNDPLTHIGIVERQEPNGTVIFISRVAGAIARYRMNLGLPHVHKAVDGRVLNDYLRRKDVSDPAKTRYLTGELFTQFATRVGH